MSIVEKPLTQRQRDFIAAVEELSRGAGFPPSLQEIAARLEVSPTRAAVLGRECEARGVAKHTPRIPRSWIVSPAPKKRHR
jgi:Mn-dependent DtxR family transcriptional regulator